MKVEIYFDVVCPWCWIGEQRFERALEAWGGPADDVEVVFRPYQLDPGAPTEAVSTRAYLEGRYGAAASSMQDRVAEAGATDGLAFDWSRAQMVNTLTAHRLVRHAQESYGADVQRALVDALFRAHFSEGVDVGDVGELARIAGSAGMDADRARDWLASGGGEAEVRAAIEDARRIGVQSVPTFVFDGKYALTGAQPLETFMHVLEDMRQRVGTEAGAGSREV